jgi:hypothetical protein
MHRAHKIATCCYCGSRTLLSLTGDIRHELACARCGAPISRMKSLPANHAGLPPRPTEPARAPKARTAHDPRWRKPPKRKRPTRLAARLLDLAEDVIDAFD